MAQLPDSIRPYALAVAKYHFWLLCLLAPLLLLPLLFMGTSALDATMKSWRSQVDNRISTLRGVKNKPDHPNDAWVKAVADQTKAIRGETLGEWRKFHDGQRGLRVWPQKLGGDFLQAVAVLEPNGTLEKKFLTRYQNNVPDIVRELPARMGAEQQMSGGTALPGAAPQPAVAKSAGRRSLVVWDAGDQQRVFQSFKWDKAPSTVQVLLAQEELWVYGLFCDAIKKANAGAAGAFDAPITSVERLAVGFEAAEDKPGGQGSNRIIQPKPRPGAVMEDAAAIGDLAAIGDTGQPAGRPRHPRFGGGSDPGTATTEAGTTPTDASPDDAFRGWIYVDFSGKPLTAAELRTNPEARMVHLMPFELRLTMDERRLDALLVDLAAQDIPIDVRQVRIGAGGGEAGQPAGGSAATSSGQASGPRPYDVRVELHGTVGLAAPPDDRALGGSEPQAGDGGAG